MSNTWWTRKLAGDQPSAPPSTLPPTSPKPPARVAPAPRPAQQNMPDVHVTDQNFAEAATLWQGGEAARTETQNCPNCGSNLYFSRSNAGTAAAPRCYACGYTQGRPMQGIPT